jgi:pilus assembly protein Flp/PilA
MRRLFKRFWRDETGATSIEYSMIAVGIAVVVLGAVQVLGVTVKGSYVSVQTALK